MPIESHRVRQWAVALLVAVAVFCALLMAGRIFGRHMMETKALTTGPNGPDTPGTLGVPFERVEIPSGRPADGLRLLDSYVVTADRACLDPPVVVIYHGVQETISDWVKAQRFLYDHCVSSVVFDYTGSGNSSRPARFEAVGEDSVAAYEFTVRHYPGKAIYVLGHSMGNGPMLEAVPHFSSAPAGVIVANAFASLRSFANQNLFYKLLARTIPDWWDNVQSVQAIRAPLLVMHSDTDRVDPVKGGREIFAAAHEPKSLTVLHGYKHNALYQSPGEEWWSSGLSFMHAPGRLTAQPSP
jgi:hypothetical protein